MPAVEMSAGGDPVRTVGARRGTMVAGCPPQKPSNRRDLPERIR